MILFSVLFWKHCYAQYINKEPKCTAHTKGKREKKTKYVRVKTKYTMAE